MPRPVDHHSYIPKHVQVSDDLRDRIETGEYEPGSNLPSTPDLAHMYEVAVMTIRRALSTLAAEHLIRTERGVRAEVIADRERNVEMLTEGDELIVRKATAEDRRRLGLAEGAEVAVVTRPGEQPRVFPAHEVRFVVTGGGGAGADR